MSNDVTVKGGSNHYSEVRAEALCRVRPPDALQRRATPRLDPDAAHYRGVQRSHHTRQLAIHREKGYNSTAMAGAYGDVVHYTHTIATIVAEQVV